MAAFTNTIQWYENKALDDPKLRSPSPCPRGVYCQYKLPNAETKELELACCRMVHPGEEGNGRRLFPARQAPDGRQQPACVRLTGNALFYERCRLKLPWRRFAAQRGIPLPPADVPWVQVERGPILRNPQAEINERHRAQKRYHHQCVAERRAAEGGSENLHERVDEVLARQAIAIAMLQANRAKREMPAAPMSAAPSSAADWPALPYGVPQRPPSIDLSAALRNASASPAPMPFRAEAPSPQVPHGPPPRLNLSGGGSLTYGFTEPPPIQRLRTERLYEEEAGCATPRLPGSVHDEEGCTTPSLIAFRGRTCRIQERVQSFCDRGANFEEALDAATREIDAEMAAEGTEGAMDGVD